MKITEQGVHTDRKVRYAAIPRSLIFVTSPNPQSGQPEILLLKGAPDKRLWANKYNGIGGHIEGDEDILAGALRELEEETGLTGVELTLRGVINIFVGGPGDAPTEPTRPQGILVFVFHGETPQRTLRDSREGRLGWFPLAQLRQLPLVDDLHQLLPLILEQDGFVYGHYRPQADGSMAYHFRTASR